MSYEIAGIYSFGRGLLRRPTLGGGDTKYRKLTRLPRDAVVYSKLGAFEGAVAVVDGEFEGRYVSPEFPTFVVGGDVDPSYLRHQLTSPPFEELLSGATAGVGARQSVWLQTCSSNKRSHCLTAQGRSRSRLFWIASTLSNRWRIDPRELRGGLVPAARNRIFSTMR